MRVGIATVQVPFISGGAEIHAQLLRTALLERGHEAEIITIPFRWDPPSQLMSYLEAVRKLDLGYINGVEIERLITMKFPMYLVRHHNKVGWILHQHRQAYELYNTELSDLHLSSEGVRTAAEIRRLDTQELNAHSQIFTNSKNVSNRLWANNRIHSQALYHPPLACHRYYCEQFDRYILAPGRVEPIKRQNLILEAVAELPHLKLILIGSDKTPYGAELKQRVETLGISDRVEMRGFVSLEEKISLYANALAIYNGAFDEDYGYITLEALFASKPVITHSDSGGPLEFVEHCKNGLITHPDVSALVHELKNLTPQSAQRMGSEGRKNVDDLNLNWDHITAQLLGDN